MPSTGPFVMAVCPLYLAGCLMLRGISKIEFLDISGVIKRLDNHLCNDGFRQVQSISLNNHIHTFRLTSLDDIDAEFRSWLAEAYSVGEQRHLDQRRNQATQANLWQPQ